MFLVCSCTEKTRNFNKVTLSVSIDDNELHTSEYEKDFRIRYFSKLKSDTIEIFPDNGYLDLPKYDSSIVYFEIAFQNCKSEIYGEMLSMELPYLIHDTLTYWNFQLDIPPFVANHDDREDKDEIEAFAYLRHDFGDLTWLCYKDEF